MVHYTTKNATYHDLHLLCFYIGSCLVDVRLVSFAVPLQQVSEIGV